MDVRRLIFWMLLVVSHGVFSKDLRPPDLKITLSQFPVLGHQSEIIPLKIKIQNISSHRGTVLIPFYQNFGKSLFTLLIYEVDANNKYNLVYSSPTELNMDTSKYKTEGSFWHLEQGEQIVLPLFLNDTKNAKRRFESSIQIPDLKTGKYALQVIYTPENSIYFKYAFRTDFETDPIVEDDVIEYPDHFLWEGSIPSNFLEFPFERLLKQEVLQPKLSSLCAAIYKQNWSKVRRLWSKRKSEKPCNCILWVYDWPQAVQLSLPAFTNYNAIFWTETGIEYVNFNYQLGKIYRARSRAAWLFHAVGFRRAPFKTSKVNWSKLIGVKPL